MVFSFYRVGFFFCGVYFFFLVFCCFFTFFVFFFFFFFFFFFLYIYIYNQLVLFVSASFDGAFDFDGVVVFWCCVSLFLGILLLLYHSCRWFCLFFGVHT